MINNQLSFNSSRVDENIEALKSLASNNPNLDLLRQYSGWGGLRDAIYTPKIYGKLKRVLNDDDINSIKSTLKSAYFTPKPLVEFIYRVVCKIGISPKSILEPSAGHGIFIEHMPKVFKDNAKISAVEIDKVSCRLLHKLYPGTNVHQQGFEEFHSEDKFDLIVGNPPFGQIYLEDKLNPDLSRFSIHHYFVAKSMRLLNKGGVLAMVVPRYFLDSSKKHVRGIIAKEGGSLLAAFRLPENLFDDAVVTVDVVFLQKTTDKNNWINANKITGDGGYAYMNQYFIDHPENILGDISFFEIYGRTEITCKNTGDISKSLSEKLANFSVGKNAETNSSSKLYQQIAVIRRKVAVLSEEYQNLVGLKNQIDQFGKQLGDLRNLALDQYSVSN